MRHTLNHLGSLSRTAGITTLVLLTGLISACQQSEPDSPDVVVVSPSPDTTTVTVTPTVSPTPTTTTSTTEPIQDVTVIVDTTDDTTLVNRRVEFTDVTVQEVISDRGFWVGNGAPQLFVQLDPSLDQGAQEQQVQIQQGQTLDLTGVLLPMPSAEQVQQEWGLTAEEAQQVTQETVYLQVDQISS